MVQAEYDEGVASAAALSPEVLERLRQEMEMRLRSVIGVRPLLKLEPPGNLPRTEFKARRVIDNRDLYRDLMSKA